MVNEETQDIDSLDELVDETEDETTEEDGDNAEETDLEDEGTDEAEEEESSEDDDLLEDEDEKDSKPGSLVLKEIADALPEKLKKRYEDQTKGFEKLKRQAEADRPLLETYRQWDGALASKDTAKDAVLKIAKAVSETHGLDLKEIFGGEPSEEASSDFEFDSDKKVHEKAVNDAVKKITDLLGVDPKDLGTFIASQKTEKQKAEAAKQVDDLLPRVMKTLKAKHDGWTPSESAVKQALLSGDLKNPIRTVKTALVDDLVAHTAKKSRSQAGPERLRGGSTPGKTLNPDPLKASALDYI